MWRGRVDTDLLNSQTFSGQFSLSAGHILVILVLVSARENLIYNNRN